MDDLLVRFKGKYINLEIEDHQEGNYTIDPNDGYQVEYGSKADMQPLQPLDQSFILRPKLSRHVETCDAKILQNGQHIMANCIRYFTFYL